MTNTIEFDEHYADEIAVLEIDLADIKRQHLNAETIKQKVKLEQEISDLKQRQRNEKTERELWLKDQMKTGVGTRSVYVKYWNENWIRLLQKSKKLLYERARRSSFYRD